MTKTHTHKPATESNGHPPENGHQTRQEAAGAPQSPKRGSRYRYADTLTTGQVATICQVAPRTVCNWFDQGVLPGFYLPGAKGATKDRRVELATLARFLLQTGQRGAYARLTGTEAPLFPGPVLLVGLEPALAARVLLLVPLCSAAPDLFTAGVAAATYRPAVVVLDAGLGRAECLVAATLLLTTPLPPRVVVLTSEDDGDEEKWLAAGVAKVLTRPIDHDALAAALTGGVK